MREGYPIRKGVTSTHEFQGSSHQGSKWNKVLLDTRGGVLVWWGLCLLYQKENEKKKGLLGLDEEKKQYWFAYLFLLQI